MPCAGRLAAVHPEITLAAECGRRGPRIDRDPLSSSAAEPPLTRPAARSSMRRSCSSTGAVISVPLRTQEGFHGSVPNALVAIDKRVAFDQCKAERRRFLNQRGVQIGGAEGGLGLRDGGLERAQSRIPEAPPVALRMRR